LIWRQDRAGGGVHRRAITRMIDAGGDDWRRTVTKPPFRPLLALLLGAALGVPAAPALAAHATSQDAQALLDKAVVELNAVGPDRAFAAFDSARGGWNTPELYVFVFSIKGVYEASGADPNLVGTNAIELTDVEGKPLVRQMIEVATTAGQGRVDYLWLNRADNHVEHKRSLVRRVGDHIVGVGYYAG
jgi:cytochrome c